MKNSIEGRSIKFLSFRIGRVTAVLNYLGVKVGFPEQSAEVSYLREIGPLNDLSYRATKASPDHLSIPEKRLSQAW